MGFSGGGTGAFSLPDHTHTNTLLDGGELEKAVSLIDGDTLQTWLANNQTLVLLDNHVASGAESSHTFTPSTALSFDDYSEFIILIDGMSTGAFQLQTELNAVTTYYYYYGRSFTGTAIAYEQGSAVANFKNGFGTCLGVDKQFMCKMSIMASQIATERISCSSKLLNVSDNITYDIDSWLQMVTPVDEINKIVVSASASSWKIGTRITMYGVKRA